MNQENEENLGYLKSPYIHEAHQLHISDTIFLLAEQNISICLLLRNLGTQHLDKSKTSGNALHVSRRSPLILVQIRRAKKPVRGNVRTSRLPGAAGKGVVGPFPALRG